MDGMGRRMKRWEAEIVKRSIGPGRLYVTRLHERMCAGGFDRDDEVYRAVIEAEAALHRLWVTLRFRSCRNAFAEWNPGFDGAPLGRPLLLTFLL
jgi:hypothetical protein